MPDLPSYGAVHKRLRRLLGPARLHPCDWCGRTADSWSYTHHPDADEHFDAEARQLWSADTSWYRPMCQRHHRQLDRAFRESGYDRCQLHRRVQGLREAAWLAVTDEQRAHEAKVRAPAVRLGRIHGYR